VTLAIRIELFCDGEVLDGTEHWWDGFEAALGATSMHLPLLEGVDPLSAVTLPADHLLDLAEECRSFLLEAPDKIKPLLRSIADLCAMGMVHEGSALRFGGA
jgi:hypothetical protein